MVCSAGIVYWFDFSAPYLWSSLMQPDKITSLQPVSTPALPSLAAFKADTTSQESLQRWWFLAQLRTSITPGHANPIEIIMEIRSKINRSIDPSLDLANCVVIFAACSITHASASRWNSQSAWSGQIADLHPRPSDNCHRSHIFQIWIVHNRSIHKVQSP